MAVPGWIKLHRQLMDNDIWNSKPFSRGQAWVDLLMLANYKDKETWIDGRCVLVKKGSFITSIRKLADRWGWSRSKTSAFLTELEHASMLTQKKDTKKTTLKITNYAKFQASDEGKGNQKEPPKSHRKATEEPQKSTTKENKKIPSVSKKEKNMPSATSPSEDEELFDDDWEDANEAQRREKDGTL